LLEQSGRRFRHYNLTLRAIRHDHITASFCPYEGVCICFLGGSPHAEHPSMVLWNYLARSSRSSATITKKIRPGRTPQSWHWFAIRPGWRMPVNGIPLQTVSHIFIKIRRRQPQIHMYHFCFLKFKEFVCCIAVGKGSVGPWPTDESEFESSYGKKLPLLHILRTFCGVHRTSYRVSTESFSPGSKRPKHEAVHSLRTSAEVMKTWICTSTPPYTFMAEVRTGTTLGYVRIHAV
jgi:hypothetical protein